MVFLQRRFGQFISIGPRARIFAVSRVQSVKKKKKNNSKNILTARWQPRRAHGDFIFRLEQMDGQFSNMNDYIIIIVIITVIIFVQQNNNTKQVFDEKEIKPIERCVLSGYLMVCYRR